MQVSPGYSCLSRRRNNGTRKLPETESKKPQRMAEALCHISMVPRDGTKPKDKGGVDTGLCRFCFLVTSLKTSLKQKAPPLRLGNRAICGPFVACEPQCELPSNAFNPKRGFWRYTKKAPPVVRAFPRARLFALPPGLCIRCGLSGPGMYKAHRQQDQCQPRKRGACRRSWRAVWWSIGRPKNCWLPRGSTPSPWGWV